MRTRLSRLTRTRLLPALLFLALSTGCMGNPGPSSESFGRDRPQQSIRIFVTNLNFMDATLWVLGSGTREKLGVVTGKQEAEYTVPWRFATDMRIEIKLLAGPRCTTQPMPVDSGDDIELIINVEMLNSSICGGLPTP